MDKDFVNNVHHANVGYSFSLVERPDCFKILISTCDKNYENEKFFNDTVEIAKFLRKLSIDEDITAWLGQNESTNGYASYVAFAKPNETNKELNESDGFWFHEDAC